MSIRKRKASRTAHRRDTVRGLARLGTSAEALYWASHFGHAGRYDLMAPGLVGYAARFIAWQQMAHTYWSPLRCTPPRAVATHDRYK